MNASRVRGVIAGLWIGFFAIDLGVVLFLWWHQAIESDTFITMVRQLNQSYVVYLGGLIGWYFIRRTTRSEAPGAAAQAPVVAIAASAIWNLTLAAIVLSIPLGVQRIEPATQMIATLSGSLSWVVAPVMAFYFATDQHTAP